VRIGSAATLPDEAVVATVAVVAISPHDVNNTVEIKIIASKIESLVFIVKFLLCFIIL
jgi:hypothetical protein